MKASPNKLGILLLLRERIPYDWPVSKILEGRYQEVKVGVYFGGMAMEAGGGYTIQNDILQAFLELRNESRHSFVVFSPRPERLRQILSVHSVELATYRSGLVEGLIKRLRKWLPAAREIMKCPSRLDHVARKNGIDFMWFASNVYVPTNIPYICNVWDLQFRLQPWFLEVGSARKWSSRESHYTDMLKRASVIIAGTQAGKDEIVHFYNLREANVRLLPHPTPWFALNSPDSDSHKDILERYNISSSYLFYPAQFWPHKNHVGLLHAIDILRNKYGIILPLVFVGSDKGNKLYVKKVVDQLNLTDQVHFLGFVPQKDLPALYRNAFAMTYLTFFGPENLPPLEAFALGCPVIASAVSGAAEQLGEAAILVDPTDHHQIALEIKTLYENPEKRQSLIAKGKSRAQAWTARDFVRNIFSILDEFEPILCTWSQQFTNFNI